MGKVTEGCVFWTCSHGLDDHQNVGVARRGGH